MDEKIIRVFPSKTRQTPIDELAFYDIPPIVGRPPDYPVKVSCTFTWDIERAEQLYQAWDAVYSDVELGGPAFDDPGDVFIPGKFVKEGMVFTSRGCPKKCPWCFVPRREGTEIRTLPITDGNIIQDNNLLACPMPHVERVFEMLDRQSKGADFRGLDAEFLTEEHVKLMRQIRVYKMVYAYDHAGDPYYIERMADWFSDFPREKKYCYVLVGFDSEPFKHAVKRVKLVWDLGLYPLPMLYQADRLEKKMWPEEWKLLANLFISPPLTIHRIKKNSAQLPLFEKEINIEDNLASIASGEW